MKLNVWFAGVCLLALASYCQCRVIKDWEEGNGYEDPPEWNDNNFQSLDGLLNSNIESEETGSEIPAYKRGDNFIDTDSVEDYSTNWAEEDLYVNIENITALINLTLSNVYETDDSHEKYFWPSFENESFAVNRTEISEMTPEVIDRLNIFEDNIPDEVLWTNIFENSTDFDDRSDIFRNETDVIDWANVFGNETDDVDWVDIFGSNIFGNNISSIDHKDDDASYDESRENKSSDYEWGDSIGDWDHGAYQVDPDVNVYQTASEDDDDNGNDDNADWNKGIVGDVEGGESSKEYEDWYRIRYDKNNAGTDGSEYENEGNDEIIDDEDEEASNEWNLGTRPARLETRRAGGSHSRKTKSKSSTFNYKRPSRHTYN